MAGKLANFIAYQSRHLEAADFTAWLKAQRDFHAAAGNLRAVKTIDRFTGLSQVERQLDKLQHDIGRKVMAPALELASNLLAQTEKSGIAHDRTGTLRQSIGSTKAKLYKDDLIAWIGSGPRRGYGRLILAQMTTKGVKLKRQNKKFSEEHHKRQSKKFSEEHQGQISTFADPVNYAHFLITGRKESIAGAKSTAKGMKATNKKALVDSFTGRFFGHSVKAAAPKDFMAPAMAQADKAANVATEEMNIRIQQLTK